MELRKLQSSDMFKMFNILSKIGIKEIKDGLNIQDFSNIDATALGVEVILGSADVILKNLPKAENDIYSFLSDLSGMTVEDIATMDMIPFTELVVAVIQKDEFKDFIQVVSKLFK